MSLRDVAFLIFAFGLVPFILYRAWYGVLAWHFVGLVSPQAFMFEMQELPIAFVVGLTTLVSLVYAKDKRWPPWNGATVFLLLLTIYVTVKMPLAWNPEVSWTHWDKFVKIALMTFVTGMLIHGERRIKVFLGVLIGSIAFFSVRGGVFTILTGGEYMVQGRQGVGVMGGNTHLGVAMVMALPLWVAVYRGALRGWVRLGVMSAFWLSVVAIVFTYSRGALLGLGAVMCLLFLQSRRKLLLAVLVAPIPFLVIGFIPEKIFDRAESIANYREDDSAMERLRAWSVSKNVAIQHPFGAGFVLDATPYPIWDAYADIKGPQFNRAAAAHSIYFQMLGDHGFPGLALFLGVLFGTFITLSRTKARIKRDGTRRWMYDYATALQIGLVGYMVSGTFVSLGYFDLFYTYAVVAAIMWREVRTQISQPATSTQSPAPAAAPDDGRRVAA